MRVIMDGGWVGCPPVGWGVEGPGSKQGAEGGESARLTQNPRARDALQGAQPMPSHCLPDGKC